MKTATLSAETTLPPREVVQRANTFLQNEGYRVTLQTPNTAQLEDGRAYNTIVLVLLVLFFLIFGIIYYFTRRRHSINVVVSENKVDITAWGNKSVNMAERLMPLFKGAA